MSGPTLVGSNGRPVESPDMKFMREQMARACQNPVEFAEMMSKITAPVMAQQQAAQAEIVKDQQRKQFWIGVYAERCKALAGDKHAPEESKFSFEVGAKMATDALEIARAAGYL